MFEAVGLLKILALSALATRNFAKSRIPKNKKKCNVSEVC